MNPHTPYSLLSASLKIFQGLIFVFISDDSPALERLAPLTEPFGFENLKVAHAASYPVAPLLGELKQYDGGTTDVMIGALNNFLVYAGYVAGYRFVPRTLQETDIQIVWIVRGDAVEGSD